jgi:alpha-amylase
VVTSASRILRKVLREEAFYFFSSIGNYIGESAASLEEFTRKIKEVNSKSLEFHLYRRDFEKWVDEVLGDAGLAERIRELRNQKLVGDHLQDQLYLTVLKRYNELKTGLPQSV